MGKMGKHEVCTKRAELCAKIFIPLQRKSEDELLVM